MHIQRGLYVWTWDSKFVVATFLSKLLSKESVKYVSLPNEITARIFPQIKRGRVQILWKTFTCLIECSQHIEEEWIANKAFSGWRPHKQKRWLLHWKNFCYQDSWRGMNCGWQQSKSARWVPWFWWLHPLSLSLILWVWGRPANKGLAIFEKTW